MQTTKINAMPVRTQERESVRLVLYLVCCSASLAMITLLTACVGRTPDVPEEVATAEKAAVSPSGKYLLVVVAGQDGTVRFQSFQILNRQSGDTLYMSEERFTARHTTYFFWDDADRVWVYSGDIGTYFWEYDPTTEQWERHAYIDSNIPAPEFLKRKMPDRYPR
jgi:hypothetical protein